MKKWIVWSFGLMALFLFGLFFVTAEAGSGKPSASIPLKASFLPILENGIDVSMIRNGVGPVPEGQYAFWHMGEGGQAVHVRILDPVNYGPLQIYIPIESGFTAHVFFSWPPVIWHNPSLDRCGWPPFLRPYSPTNDGVDVLAPKTFIFSTGMILEEVTSEGVTVLQNTNVYLNLSKMGVGTYPSKKMAQSQIKLEDNASRVFWLGDKYPVWVEVAKFNTSLNRPEEWTIWPIEASYSGWETPGVRELGAPLVNRKAPGTNWWCAFGDWNMPFILKLARQN